MNDLNLNDMHTIVTFKENLELSNNCTLILID